MGFVDLKALQKKKKKSRILIARHEQLQDRQAAAAVFK